MRPIVALLLTLCVSLTAAEPAAWRARHPAHPGELLLLGSIHVLKATDHPLPQRVDALVAESDRVVFELDLDDMAAMQIELGTAAVLPPGQSLRTMLGAELHASASTQAELYGLQLDLLDRYQPWFVAVSLTALGMHVLGYRAEYGVEHHVRETALAAGKEILGLESITDQIGVFSELTPEQQALLLAQAVEGLHRSAQTMAKLVGAWERGELSELRDGLVAEFDSFPGLYSRLIVERNDMWAVRLDELARDDARSLVVVGALHLVGDDSIVQRLHERGFEIESIP